MSSEGPQRSAESDVFLQELHDALLHLRDLPIRRSHPLSRHFDQSSPTSTTNLQRILVDAIEQLRPPPHIAPDATRSRRFRYLKLRYVEGARLEEVVAELGISGRQARREHHLALQELAALLIRGGSRTADFNALPPFPDEANPKARPTRDDGDVSADASRSELEIELAQVDNSPPIELLDVGVAVEDALDLVARLAASRSVVVEYVAGEALPAVVASRTALRQILLNLLSYFINTDSLARVRLTAVETTAGVEIRFMPVPTGGSRTSLTRKPSSGLAASLEAASRLAEGQEGSIQLEEIPGGLMAVNLLLLTAKTTLVLVVDDNPSLVRLFRRYVRGAGYRLAQARNSIRAREVARTLRPDLIILDLMMPVQDGWDLFRSLQGDPATSAIPVVACSILPERELALSLGALDFIAKPVTPESLLRALEPFRRPTRPVSPGSRGDVERPGLP